MDTFLRYLNGFEKRARSERKYIAFNKETNYEQGLYIVNTKTFLATDARMVRRFYSFVQCY